jgi:hypothetical protein
MATGGYVLVDACMLSSVNVMGHGSTHLQNKLWASPVKLG